MRGSFRISLTVAAVSLLAGAAFAHHSTAAYDLTKSVTVRGTVKHFQWANPHNYIQLIVANRKGDGTEWAIEAGTPATATRQGWTKSIIKPGDKVVVVLAPMRNGAPGGTVKTLTLPNGRTLQSVAADPGATRPFESLPTLERASPE